MHVWDLVTPVEEVLHSLGDLARAGKIRDFGFSDMPAWYAAKAVTLAEAHAVPRPIALQLARSAVERTIRGLAIAASTGAGPVCGTGSRFRRLTRSRQGDGWLAS